MVSSSRSMRVALFFLLPLSILSSRLLIAENATVPISCKEETTLATGRITEASAEAVISLADDLVSSGESIAAELERYRLSLGAFTRVREMPLLLDGQVTNSILLLDQPRNGEHAWLVLFSPLPDIVRTELRRQGIAMQWDGFILRENEAELSTPLRLVLLGDRSGEYLFDVKRGTFRPVHVPSALVDNKANSSCFECIRDLITNVVCESVALSLSCETGVGCPGAAFNLLIRAVVRLITNEPCFPVSLAGCAGRCLIPISLTPASNTRLPLNRSVQITAKMDGPLQPGAWFLISRSGSVQPPLFSLRNPPRVTWTPSEAGTYTIRAGNIPWPGASMLLSHTVSSGIVVGNPTPTSTICYVDAACYSGNQTRARSIQSNQCVPLASCSALWKCEAGARGGSCGGGSQECTFSPGCFNGVQTCSHGNCVSLSTCTDRIKYQGYAVNPTPNQCSCAGNPPDPACR